MHLVLDDATHTKLNRLVAILRKNDRRKGRKPISKEKAIAAIINLFFLAHASSLEDAFLEVLVDEQRQPRKHRFLGSTECDPLPTRRGTKGTT